MLNSELIEGTELTRVPLGHFTIPLFAAMSSTRCCRRALRSPMVRTAARPSIFWPIARSARGPQCGNGGRQLLRLVRARRRQSVRQLHGFSQRHCVLWAAVLVAFRPRTWYFGLFILQNRRAV